MTHSIAFCGTPEFAVPSLECLISDPNYEVKIVLTQPDRPAGRGKKLKPSPVKICAEKHNIPVLTPEKVSVGDTIESLQSLNLDLGVVVAYGQILPESFLKSFKKGCVNIHSSLLPRWRGAAPMQRAIMSGDKTTGVSLQRVVQKLDAGDIIGEIKMDLPLEMGTRELYETLSHKGCDLLLNPLKEYMEDKVSLKKQDESLITYAHKIQKEEGLIDWSGDAMDIHNKIRGLNMGGPFAYTRFQGKQLKIHKSLPKENQAEIKNGSVTLVNKDSFEISCGSKSLEIFEVQPESKSKMKAGDFIRGYHLKEGDCFGE